MNPGRSDDAETAVSELQRYSWAVLNADFNQEVLQSWGEDDLAEIQKRLGYRYALAGASAPRELAPGRTASSGCSCATTATRPPGGMRRSS